MTIWCTCESSHRRCPSLIGRLIVIFRRPKREQPRSTPQSRSPPSMHIPDMSMVSAVIPAIASGSASRARGTCARRSRSRRFSDRRAECDGDDRRIPVGRAGSTPYGRKRPGRLRPGPHFSARAGTQRYEPFLYSAQLMFQSVQPLPFFSFSSVPLTVTGSPMRVRSKSHLPMASDTFTQPCETLTWPC
jgi:hypothetical protein